MSYGWAGRIARGTALSRPAAVTRTFFLLGCEAVSVTLMVDSGCAFVPRPLTLWLLETGRQS